MLHAYAHVDGEAALKAAQGIDALLASGTDLGPLMGCPSPSRRDQGPRHAHACRLRRGCRRPGG
ncbi:hypothetical protein ACTMU2_15130 [Cupriavidus basilensis]